MGNHFFSVTSSCSPSSRPFSVRVSPTAAVFFSAGLASAFSSVLAAAFFEEVFFGVVVTVSSPVLHAVSASRPAAVSAVMVWMRARVRMVPPWCGVS